MKDINRYYKQLEGATIVEFCGVLGEDEYTLEGFPTFKVRMPSGDLFMVEVSRDQEGNGGGFLFQGEWPKG